MKRVRSAQPDRKETEVLAEVSRYLQARGVWYLRCNSGLFRLSYQGRERWVRAATPGCADLLATPLVNGTPVIAWIETKRPKKGKHQAEQKLFRRTVLQYGHGYCLARSAAEAHEWLTKRVWVAGMTPERFAAENRWEIEREDFLS